MHDKKIIYKDIEADKDIISFKENGYVIFNKILSDDVFTEASNKINEKLKTQNEPSQLHNLHLSDPWFLNFVLRQEFTDIAKRLLGVKNIKVFTSMILNKPPNGLMTVPWHQDAAYGWPIDPIDCATLWLAFDEVTVENGAMEFAAGAHRAGVFPMVESEILNEDKCLFPNKVLNSIADVSLNKYKKVYLTIGQGGASFHHSLLPHRSNPNKTNNRRCAFSVRYCLGDVKMTKYNGMKREKDFKSFELVDVP